MSIRESSATITTPFGDFECYVTYEEAIFSNGYHHGDLWIETPPNRAMCIYAVTLSGEGNEIDITPLLCGDSYRDIIDEIILGKHGQKVKIDAEQVKKYQNAQPVFMLEYEGEIE